MQDIFIYTRRFHNFVNLLNGEIRNKLIKINTKRYEIMTEIQKLTKISLLLNVLAGLIFAFLYLVIPDIYIYGLTQWPFNDPIYFRLFGGTLLVLGLVSLMAYFKKEWEEIKLLYELSVMWLLMVTIINIFELALLTLPAMALTNSIFVTILVAIYLILGIYCWMKQRG